MLTKPFSIKASLKEGWHLVRGTKLAILMTILPMSFVALIAFITISGIEPQSSKNSADSLFFSLLLPFIDTLVISGFIAGIMMIGLKRARNQALRYSDGLKYFNKLPKLAIIGYLETLLILLISSTVLIGMAYLMAKLGMPKEADSIITLFVLLIAVFGLKTLLIFSFQLALDKGFSIFSAIAGSIKIVRHHYGKILAIFIILIMANFLGACLAGIGLLWTIPFTTNTLGVVYRQLFDISPMSDF
ncbi:MAG: hypothetical protein Q7V63_03515 [Gammaproteobacteria bacterium]|nr:hypothetical protein [Gammaproteobacteria bacterium]